MSLTAGEQVLLRLYLRSGDRAPRTPTYELLLKAARRAGLSGATVLRGIMGFGRHGEARPSTWTIVEHVPVIVEIVDTRDRIENFISDAIANHLMDSGVATLERAFVMAWRHRGGGSAAVGSLNLAAVLPPPPLSSSFGISERPDMKTNTEGVLLRVFIGDSDRDADSKPLYETIVREARELGLAGATVLRGSEGFGAHSVVHKAQLLEMSSDLPIVIEIVDTREKIQLLLPHLEAIVTEGMITMEHVTILIYRHE